MATSTRRMTILSLTALALLTSSASAQEGQWALKMFEETGQTRHDFGHVARGADVQHVLTFKNIYKETVHISNVRSSCGCATPKVINGSVETLQEGSILVTIDTERHSRDKTPNITITFDAPYFAEVTIPMTVYIRTDVVLTPGSVNFGAIDLGAGGEKRLNVNYAGRSDWAIQGVKTNNKFLNARIQETNRNGGKVDYELLVTLSPDAPVGILRDQILLMTNDAAAPRVPILVEGRIESDITVTPSPLSLGTLVPGQSKVANVVLRGKKPFSISKIECESPAQAFQVRLPKSASKVQIVPLTVIPPQAPGEFSETFTITIEGRPEPLTFRAYGQIVVN